MNKYCIACGGILKKEEKKIHNKCIKKIFSTNTLPQIKFNLDEISLQVQKTIGKLSISGMQPKLSLKLNKKKHILEVVETKGEFILKPPTNRFRNLPEIENLFMSIFQIVKIKTALHTLIPLQDNSIVYIVKRFDRKGNKKIHFEDFQSILNTRDKYAGSAEAIASAIKKYSKFPGLDLREFLKILIMNFIIGNGDAHLKNYGLLYDENGNKNLAPCYDIVCSKLFIKDEEDSAITINGKKNKITLNDFFIFAKKFQINNKMFSNILEEIFEYKDIIFDYIIDYPYLNNTKQEILNIINQRFKIFGDD